MIAYSCPISKSEAWFWRHWNLMFMGGETWSLHRLSCNVKNSMESILVSFPPSATTASTNRYTKWNNNIISGAILNVDGRCHGTPIRIGFGGVLRNDSSLFLSSFFGFIPDPDDILLAELSAIYHSITMKKYLGYAEFACYFDSLVCINLIYGPIERYHIFAVLIQDKKKCCSIKSMRRFLTLLKRGTNVQTSWQNLELLVMLIFFMSRPLLVLSIFS